MPTNGKRRALVVEDQTTLREFLSELVADDFGYLVDAVATGEEALRFLQQHTYDLLLLDLVLPDMHGVDLLDRVWGKGPRVLVLTAHARPAAVREAMERGAHGVATKGAPLRELREAIERVRSGGVYFSSETSELLRKAAVQPERDEQLTPRQREILRAVAKGLSSKEIAAQLSIAEKTVSNHRARIMERVGVHDIAGLTRYAISLGLIDPEE
jgi:DNA-binding NarL/FixJ family response regulator